MLLCILDSQRVGLRGRGGQTAVPHSCCHELARPGPGLADRGLIGTRPCVRRLTPRPGRALLQQNLKDANYPAMMDFKTKPLANFSSGISLYICLRRVMNLRILQKGLPAGRCQCRADSLSLIETDSEARRLSKAARQPGRCSPGLGPPR
jgi:hypothetical protein